ncbi:MAG: amidohydrolase [Clostridia bacterium]|nr:amidohydrolase [Clostridia bacterium]
MPIPSESMLLETLRFLHSHPETAFEEHETTAHLRAALEEAGIAVHPCGLDTGLIAQIDGALPGPTVGLRADIDALPIQEDSGLACSSVIPGRMHACGHDFHAAAVLGAALMLHAQRDTLPGRVMVIFQPAEEVDGGGRIVARHPLLHECKCFLAGHTYPGFPAGTVGVREGAVMAAVDRFRLVIRGVGVHAAHPHAGIDPIVVQAALVQSLQTIVSRTMSPFSHSLVSVTHVEAGNTWNVIPSTAMLEGTVRTLDPADRERVEKQFCQIVSGVGAAYGTPIDIEWTRGSPAVINDPALCELARSTALAQGLTVDRQDDTLGGEDFSQYLMDKPGVFVRIGTGGQRPAHHPGFTVDPAALYPAARYFAALARACLEAPLSL